MSLVVLLRGANLGKRRFKPTELVAALDDLDITSIGAAGTFVVRKRIAMRTLRAQVQAELPWDDAEMVVLKEDGVLAALAAGKKVHVPTDAKRFGIALPKAPGRVELPLVASAKDGKLGMRYDAVEGRVVIGVRRRWDETGPYSTKEIDDAIGADEGTMRDWPTWEKIGRALEAPTGD